MSVRHILSGIAMLGVLASALLPLPVAAQPFPNRPVRIVVPFTPGGGPDVVARIAAQKLGEAWRQPVVVENRPGASGNLAVDFVVKSPPDGYTWLVTPANVLVMNPHLTKANFNTLTDLTPLGQVASQLFVLAINASVQANTVAEFIALAKANPGRMNYASSGNGSPQHVAMELFRARTGVELLHVAYKGQAPAVTDLIAGQVQALIGSANTIMPHATTGKLRVLGAASVTRYQSLPNIPTLAESGLPGYDLAVWMGFVVPAGTPADIVRSINGDLVKAFNDPEVRERMITQGIESKTGTVQEMAELIRTGHAQWGEIIRRAGIKAD